MLMTHWRKTEVCLEDIRMRIKDAIASLQLGRKKQAPVRRLCTVWSEQAENGPDAVPLAEYPRPQFRRAEWQCLNGWWEYSFRQAGGLTGNRIANSIGEQPAAAAEGKNHLDEQPVAAAEGKLPIDEQPAGAAEGKLPIDEQPVGAAEGKILVPFSPETVRSGVGRTLLPGQELWYRREIENLWIPKGKRLLLHFGGVDERCMVWWNGVRVGVHRNGYLAFSFDVTEVARPGTNFLEICVRDDTDKGTARRDVLSCTEWDLADRLAGNSSRRVSFRLEIHTSPGGKLRGNETALFRRCRLCRSR